MAQVEPDSPELAVPKPKSKEDAPSNTDPKPAPKKAKAKPGVEGDAALDAETEKAPKPAIKPKPKSSEKETKDEAQAETKPTSGDDENVVDKPAPKPAAKSTVKPKPKSSEKETTDESAADAKPVPKKAKAKPVEGDGTTAAETEKTTILARKPDSPTTVSDAVSTGVEPAQQITPASKKAKPAAAKGPTVTPDEKDSAEKPAAAKPKKSPAEDKTPTVTEAVTEEFIEKAKPSAKKEPYEGSPNQVNSNDLKETTKPIEAKVAPTLIHKTSGRDAFETLPMPEKVQSLADATPYLKEYLARLETFHRKQQEDSKATNSRLRAAAQESAIEAEDLAVVKDSLRADLDLAESAAAKLRHEIRDLTQQLQIANAKKLESQRVTVLDAPNVSQLQEHVATLERERLELEAQNKKLALQNQRLASPDAANYINLEVQNQLLLHMLKQLQAAPGVVSAPSQAGTLRPSKSGVQMPPF